MVCRKQSNLKHGRFSEDDSEEKYEDNNCAAGLESNQSTSDKENGQLQSGVLDI